MDEEEHEVYGGEIPDDGEMEGDAEAHHADDMSAADDDAVKELDEMKKRLKEMEEELRLSVRCRPKSRKKWVLLKILLVRLHPKQAKRKLIHDLYMLAMVYLFPNRAGTVIL